MGKPMPGRERLRDHSVTALHRTAEHFQLVYTEGFARVSDK